MNESQISVRYAKALFRSALENNELEKVYGDMQILGETCEMEQFDYMLSLPSMKGSEKEKMIDVLLKKHISNRSMSLIKLVIANKRETYLGAIARNFIQLYRGHHGIKSASLLTASEVDEKAMKGIRELISKAYDSDVELSNGVDEKLLGGFVLTIEDKQYDASISTGLRTIRKELLETRIEKK